MAPVAWTFDKLGRADRMFKGFHQQNLRRLKKANPFKAVGTLTTRATADILNLDAGVWYYRVRGVDGTLPTSQRGMTWSDPQYLKIVPRTFSVIRHRPL